MRQYSLTDGTARLSQHASDKLRLMNLDHTHVEHTLRTGTWSYDPAHANFGVVSQSADGKYTRLGVSPETGTITTVIRGTRAKAPSRFQPAENYYKEQKSKAEEQTQQRSQSEEPELKQRQAQEEAAAKQREQERLRNAQQQTRSAPTQGRKY